MNDIRETVRRLLKDGEKESKSLSINSCFILLRMFSLLLLYVTL